MPVDQRMGREVTAESIETLGDLLLARASSDPWKNAFVFLTKDLPDSPLTNESLRAKACALSIKLRETTDVGDSVLISLPPGPEYVASLFACFLSGLIAVPYYPPQRTQDISAYLRIVADASPRVVIASRAVTAMLEEGPGERLPILDPQTVDDSWASNWSPQEIDPGKTAMLQYTSGSTRQPRGVELSHANILTNCAMIRERFSIAPNDLALFWLPPYHDMGLIGGIIEPLVCGVTSLLMSPMHFVERPMFWLEAISNRKVTVSGAPDFAYSLSVRRSTIEERNALDLRSWTIAFTGSEPVRARTLDEFSDAFARAGFRRNAFLPCYGLAEATLLVSSARRGAGPRVISLARNRTAGHQGDPTPPRLASAVSVGTPAPGTAVAIRDSTTGLLCSPGEIGEVHVSSGSVGKGYWNRPTESDEVFRVHLDGVSSVDQAYLRTGDLGLLVDGELFIVGRADDRMLIRGRNFYPEDIEMVVQEVLGTRRPTVAFYVAEGAKQGLTVLQEMSPTEHGVGLFRRLREVLAKEFGLQPATVVFVPPKTIPRTTSGKIRRFKSRELYVEGAIEGVADKITATVADRGPVRNQAASSRERSSSEDGQDTDKHIARFIVSKVAELVGRAEAQISLADSPMGVGLDSLRYGELASALADNFGVQLPYNALLTAESLRDLAQVASANTRHPVPTRTGDGRGDADTPGIYSLSAEQRDVWVADALDSRSGTFNIARAYSIVGHVEPSVLQGALQRLVKSHPALRTTFPVREGEPLRHVHSASNMPVSISEMNVEGWLPSLLHAKLEAAASEPFDLARGPLLRVEMFARAREESILLVTIHHIIVDFQSLSLLSREFEDMLSAFPDLASFTQPEVAPAAEHFVSGRSADG
jgi:acyl-CoA synthetase (AMP-forming)/AMP-acid ligase II/acyl carrier protein